MDIFQQMGDVFADTLGRDLTITSEDGAQISGKMIYLANAKRTEIGDYGAEIVTHSPELHIPAQLISKNSFDPLDLLNSIVLIDDKAFELSEPEFDGATMYKCKLYVTSL